ncbi:hypothetical protein V6N11_076848 [Hibiscus sabdariffa]|uniref:Uncharacterized protein n=2 Tax=Hibiscus sabdariffa TaxID=183260 RepID=A0ABR2TBS1_9ROSI
MVNDVQTWTQQDIAKIHSDFQELEKRLEDKIEQAIADKFQDIRVEVDAARQEMMEVKAFLEAVFGRTCTSKDILGAAPTEGLNLELTEWVGEGSAATTSIKDTTPKVDLKMSNKCAVRVFDEMLERDDKVKVDRHFNAVCGDSNEVQNSIALSEIVDYVQELPMLSVVETLTADGSDNALLRFHLPVQVLFQLPKVIASSPSISTSNLNLNIVPKVIRKPNSYLENSVDPIIDNALIEMYSKCGYRDNAWVVLKVTDNRSIVSWTKMTMKCTQNGQVREAFNTLDEMVAKELIGLKSLNVLEWEEKR